MHRNLKIIASILKQEGTSQYERYPAALNPASIKLDGRKLQDLIAYVQRYAKNLLFIDTDAGKVNLEDSWEYFFGNDNIVILIAGIATKNVEELKETYDTLQLKFTRGQTHEHFRELLNYVFARFKKINNWYHSTPYNNALKADLVLYIQSYLQKELESLKEIIFYIRDQGDANYSHHDFLKEFYGMENMAQLNHQLSIDDVWEISKKENIPLREQIFAGNSEEEKLNNAGLILNKIFDAVFYATGNIINDCKIYFEETIHQKHDHPPHIAFLITFIKLYGYAQEELNKIPLRHLDYYYKNILQIKPKEATPDQAFIVFDLAKGFESYRLKKGTMLTAGKDAHNTDLVYETDDEIVVSKAQVASLQTVFIDRNQQNQPLNYYKAAIISGGVQPPAAPANTAASYKIFGDANAGSVAEIGFGIASTQFYLAKGERNVVINFLLQDDITTGQFDTGILKLLLTGEKGWLNSDDSKSGIMIRSLKRAGNQVVELSFTISIAQESAIVPFNSKIHEGNYNTPLPVLQCVLKYPPLPAGADEQVMNEWKEKIAQLNSLQKLKITATTIRVQVGSIQTQASFDGIKDLLLENSEAPLDSKKPFYPFTSIPKPGSSFYIGCNDLFYKEIDRLSVNIEWMLPNDFASYYSKYLPPYDSNRFIASLSVLQKKYWKKLKDISVIDKEASDPRFKAIKIDADTMKMEAASSSSENPVSTFDNDKMDGTLKLKLKYPDFGHSIYPQLITSAVMEKATAKSSNIDYYEIVKKQLGDSTISIKLPPDIESGKSLKVVYNILDKEKDDNRAKEGLSRFLGEEIKKFNRTSVELKKQYEGLKIVNDDNFIERVLGFLKKVKIIDTRIHYDKDKQDADTVINAVKDKINIKADFIIPGDRELVGVVFNETNAAINTIVTKLTDWMIARRAAASAMDTAIITTELNKEIAEANQVINDIIAHKIAILLSTNEIPPPPYTPLINAISLSYTSIKDSRPDKASISIDDQFFHITPLGVFEIDIDGGNSEKRKDNNRPLLTTSVFPGAIVENPETPAEIQGMLFIGIAQAKPGQNVTILVQIAEGTKRNDKKPPPVNWWYLRNYSWVKLNDDYLVSDTTYGLQTTGIVEISIPAQANNESVIFDTHSLFWLCAGTTEEADAFPKLFGISSQAVTATFKDRGNDPVHLSLPLEAKKITGLVQTIPQIKKLSQPVSSFGGQVKEQGQDYYTRVSERLRHKNRAISNWDYERLVLENFPSLFKVKCLNNYYNGQFAVGHVTILPIANLTNKSYEGNHLLIPRTSYIDLMRIEKFLLKKTSPFVKIHAVNPQLDHVLIHCSVKFHTGVDKGFYLQQLNDDLIRFLTPWASGDSAELSFSTKIYSSSIVNFIDRKNYVDYVTDVVMEQYTENESGEKDFCTEEDELTSLVETQITTGHSIIVSAPKHDIELVE